MSELTDDTIALLRDHPAVLLPSGTTADQVEEAVGQWASYPSINGDGGLVAHEISWHGPIELYGSLVEAAKVPEGYGIAYVAQTRRSRILEHKRFRTIRRWAHRYTDSGLGLDPAVGERMDSDIEALYPDGLPVGVEKRAWDLVRGVARQLHGLATLPGNPPQSPGPEDNPGAIVYSAQAITVQQAVDALQDLLSAHRDLDEPQVKAGFWMLESADGTYTVEASPVDPDDVPPAAADLGDQLYSYDATANDRDALEHDVAQRLAELTGGVVLDEFGFRR